MLQRPDIQLRTSIKALTETVLPAVDKDNPVAIEQAQMVIGLLSMMESRISLQHKFDCDELERLIGFSEQLHKDFDDQEVVAALRSAEERGRTLLNHAQAFDPQDLRDMIKEIRHLTSTTIKNNYSGLNASLQSRVLKGVLDMSSEQILRDRSWVSPQGWEPDPSQVPEIESLINADS